jgi:hypothetical protein
MTTWPRSEIEQAFRHYFMTGIVYEDWTAWSKLFTDDASYHDHFWGTFHGPSEIERFLEGTMSGACHVYSALKWYCVGEDRVIYEVFNRADHPIEGRPPIEFSSIQVICYAGNGKWKSEEDWWVMADIVRMRNQWLAALSESGTPDFGKQMSRRDWGPWVDWARPAPGHIAHPSWVGKNVEPIPRLKDISFGIRTPIA